MSDINTDINRVVLKLRSMEKQYLTAINEKTILRRAGKVVKETMKQEVPTDTGNLKESLDFLNFRSDKTGVHVGARYNSSVNQDGERNKPIGRHAHLVEFGFIDRSGKRVDGNPFVKRTYEKTKLQVIKNLEKETEKLQKKIERSLAI
jgi:HK97 gp10 family phage protein